MERSNLLVCLICSKECKNLSIHLRKTHDLSSAAYQAEYPNSLVVSKYTLEKIRSTKRKPMDFQQRKKISDAVKKLWKDPNYSNRVFPARKGKKITKGKW